MQPTIVGVPGAWHGSNFFDGLSETFHKAGYTFVSQDPQSIEIHDAHQATVDADADHLRTQVLVPLIEAGKDVVMLMHSYGGVYGAGSAQGLSWAERRKAGLPGGIVSLIFISAVPAIAKKSTLELMGTTRANLPQFAQHDEKTGWVTFAGARDSMYHDLDEDDAEKRVAMLRPQALNALDTPVSYSPTTDSTYSGMMTYIICGRDRVIPPEGQKLYAKIAGIEDTRCVDNASHAFFTPNTVNEVVDRVLQIISDLHLKSVLNTPSPGCSKHPHKP